MAATGPLPRRVRDQFNGIWWRFRTGTGWRDVPERYGPWSTVYPGQRLGQGRGVPGIDGRADLQVLGLPVLAGLVPQPHVVALLPDDLLDPLRGVVVQQMRRAPRRFQGSQLLAVDTQLLQDDRGHHVHVGHRPPKGLAPAHPAAAAITTPRHATPRHAADGPRPPSRQPHLHHIETRPQHVCQRHQRLGGQAASSTSVKSTSFRAVGRTDPADDGVRRWRTRRSEGLWSAVTRARSPNFFTTTFRGERRLVGELSAELG
ncbi:transposase [Microtetraspora sp. AC03309]|uniref:transposase n=1 Tax=Microtetraspora sp. AC03309 TaxID=2779376 RepID=UPI0035B29C77